MASIIAAACTPVRSDIPTAVPNADFDLPVRGAVRLDGTQIVIRFDTLTDESRCPEDVQCVWAGNATIRLAVDSGDASSAVELRTSVQQPASVFGRRIELRALRPYPNTRALLRYDSYVATLRVLP